MVYMGNIFKKNTSQPTIIKIKYSDIKSQIRPFDLIFFRGSEIISDIISFFEKKFQNEDKWTHVGMVISPDILNFDVKTSDLYIWESTMSGKLGDGAKKIIGNTFGVQIRNLNDVVQHYDSNKTFIGWSKCKYNPLDKLSDESETNYIIRKTSILSNLQIFFDNHKNASYDANPLHLLSTIFPKLSKHTNTSGISPDLGEKFFCSELVSSIYIVSHILPSSLDPEEISPVELLQCGCVENPIYICY